MYTFFWHSVDLDASYIDRHLVALKKFKNARKEKMETQNGQKNLEIMVKVLAS